MERKFMELAQPKCFKTYFETKGRFEFSSFDSQIERLAVAWDNQGDFAQRIQGYMSLAPFIGNLTSKDYSKEPRVTLFSDIEVMNHPILTELVGEDARRSLAGMLKREDYKGGLKLETGFVKGHPEPEFVVPALGTKDRNLVFYLDRCGSAPAYSFLFEKI